MRYAPAVGPSGKDEPDGRTPLQGLTGCLCCWLYFATIMTVAATMSDAFGCAAIRRMRNEPNG